MPEKPGFHPENQILTEEQQTEVNKLFSRLFEAYFSGIDLKLKSKLNSQIIAERFNQLHKQIQLGFQYLTRAEKDLLISKIREKIEKAAENGETKNNETAPIITEAEKPAPPKSLEEKEGPPMNAEMFFEKLQTLTTTEISSRELLSSFLAHLNLSLRGQVEKERISFFEEATKMKSVEKNKPETFQFRCRITTSDIDILRTCSVYFKSFKSGKDPKKLTTKYTPVWYTSTLKNYV